MGSTSFIQETANVHETDSSGNDMMGTVQKHYVTRVVENLCAFKNEDDTFLYLDPKVSKGRGEVDVLQLKREMMARIPIKEVVAFSIGGGCYAEYQNLQMIEQGGDIRVCYGCTELLNSNAFLAQLSDLG